MSGVINNIKYTWNHKKAFLKVEKELLGRNTIGGYLHDLDKIFLYILMDKYKTHKIHRKFSRHHNNEKHKNKKDYVQMIIDWECARYTKPDKPLSAREFLYKIYSIKYPELVNEIEPILKELNL